MLWHSLYEERLETGILAQRGFYGPVDEYRKQSAKSGTPRVSAIPGLRSAVQRHIAESLAKKACKHCIWAIAAEPSSRPAKRITFVRAAILLLATAMMRNAEAVHKYISRATHVQGAAISGSTVCEAFAAILQFSEDDLATWV